MELSKSRINKYRQLRHKKKREEFGLFMAEGLKAVRDTVKSFQIEAVVSASVDVLADFSEFVEEDLLYKASPSEMEKLSALATPGEVIAIYRLPLPDDDISVREGEFCLMLDGVQDPGNLGTIIRTAHWFGIRQIFCSPDTVDLYNPKTIQSTMGSISRVKVKYADLREVIDSNPGMPVYGLMLDGENIFERDRYEPGFIIMGNEGRGVRKETTEKITRALTIPPGNTDDHPDSLNVAIATAITLSQLLK